MSSVPTYRCPDCGSVSVLGFDAIRAALHCLTSQPPPTALAVWLVATHDADQPTQLVVAGDAAEALALVNAAYGLGTAGPDDIHALNLCQARLLPAVWTGSRA